MARKIPGFSRALGARSLASVAFGEIASSLYFALGVVALHALGFTPWVLLVAGVLFLLVALSYAEGTAAIPETGGAATFVRRAFNDPLGFLTGWALCLDYLIVIALAALFVPHYAGEAVGWNGITRGPWDVLFGVGVILALALTRLVRRPALYRIAVIIAGVSFFAFVTIVVLGLAIVVSRDSFSTGVDLGTAPTWGAIAFALPLAMLAYTGLETVANLAAETREPGRTLPRSLFAGIGIAVVVSVAIGVVGIAAYPAHPEAGGPGGYASDLGTEWLRAPIVGIVAAFDGSLPTALVDVLRIVFGLSGTLVLVAAITTSISGAGRLAYSLGQHGMLPRAYGQLNRRTLIAPISILSTAAIACVLLAIAAWAGREVRFLASLYSFGVLIAFTAAQLAVIRLRFTEPDLRRPFRVPWNLRIAGREVPVAALVGAPLTFGILVAALATHRPALIAGPIWLLIGAVIFVAVRRASGKTLLAGVEPGEPDLVPSVEGIYERILVPVKLGPIGEEVLATAIRLAEERRSAVIALHVILVSLDLPIDAALDEAETEAQVALAHARELALEHGVEVEEAIVRGRTIGDAIVSEAATRNADLVLMGSAPRWRRQSRFFSPTVDHVLRRASCEVMVVAYPLGLLEAEELEAESMS